MDAEVREALWNFLPRMGIVFVCRRERFRSMLYVKYMDVGIVLNGHTSAGRFWSLTCFPRAVIRIWWITSMEVCWKTHDWSCSILFQELALESLQGLLFEVDRQLETHTS
jgi:hypothetical protein